MDLFIKGLQID